MYSSFERSANAKKQLRDKYGKWIFMGGLGKFFDALSNSWKTGTVDGINGDYVHFHGDDGHEYNVHRSYVESIPSKAHLPGTNTPNVSAPAKAPTTSVPHYHGAGDSFVSAQATPKSMYGANYVVTVGKDGQVYPSYIKDGDVLYGDGNGGLARGSKPILGGSSFSHFNTDGETWTVQGKPKVKGGSNGGTTITAVDKDGNTKEFFIPKSDTQPFARADAQTDQYIKQQEDAKKASIPTNTKATTEPKADTDEITDASSWKKTGNLGGSNGAAIYEDEDGNKYVLKFPPSESHAKNEVLASRLYGLAGVPMPHYELASRDGKLGVYSPYMEDIDTNGLNSALNKNDSKYLDKLREDFGADAWLANWDVAGLANDNVISDKDGDPIRVDPGGSLIYRAQGSPKGAAWNKDANEWETLRDSSTSPQGSKIFNGMSDEQLKDSAQKVANISDADIDYTVDSVGLSDKDAADMKATLKARRDAIAKKAGVTPHPDEDSLGAKAQLPAPTSTENKSYKEFLTDNHLDDNNAATAYVKHYAEDGNAPEISTDNYVPQDGDIVQIGDKSYVVGTNSILDDQDKVHLQRAGLSTPGKGSSAKKPDGGSVVSKSDLTPDKAWRPGASKEQAKAELTPEATSDTQEQQFHVLPSDQRGKSGDGYHESGPWGKYGASGVLIHAQDTDKYYIVQRGGFVSSNKGKWQLPGGAMEEHENPYQGASRELTEETSFTEDDLKDLSHAGDVVFDNGKGWQYTNIAANIPNEKDITVDPKESADGKWVSADELKQMRDNGELVPAFSSNLDNILAKYNEPDNTPEVEHISEKEAEDVADAPQTPKAEISNIPEIGYDEVNDVVANHADEGGSQAPADYNLPDGTHISIDPGDEDHFVVHSDPEGKTLNTYSKEEATNSDFDQVLENSAFGSEAPDRVEKSAPRVSPDANDLDSLAAGDVVKLSDAAGNKVFIKQPDGTFEASWLPDDHKNKYQTSDQIHAVAAYTGQDVQVVKETEAKADVPEEATPTPDTTPAASEGLQDFSGISDKDFSDWVDGLNPNDSVTIHDDDYNNNETFYKGGDDEWFASGDTQGEYPFSDQYIKNHKDDVVAFESSSGAPQSSAPSTEQAPEPEPETPQAPAATATPDVAKTIDGINYDSNGDAWVPDKSGNAISLGTVVKNKSGELGKVDYIQKGGKKVRVKTEDGNTKFWNAHMIDTQDDAAFTEKDSPYQVHTDTNGENYVKTFDGENLYVGDEAKTEGKTGISGKVVGFAKGGEFVLIEDAKTGDVKPRKLDKVQKTKANHADVPEAEVPASNTPEEETPNAELQPGDKITSVAPLADLPVGSQINYVGNKGTVTYVKQEDGSWNGKGNNGTPDYFDDDAFSNAAKQGKLEYSGMSEASPAQPAPEPGTKVPSDEDFKNYPVGTVVTHKDQYGPATTYTKVSDDSWESGDTKDIHDWAFAGAIKEGTLYTGEEKDHPGVQEENATPEPAESTETPETGISISSVEEVANLPEGSYVEGKNMWGETQAYVKMGDGKWHMAYPDGYLSSGVWPDSAIAVLDDAQKKDMPDHVQYTPSVNTEPGAQVDSVQVLKAMPTGTKISVDGLGNFTKDYDGSWQSDDINEPPNESEEFASLAKDGKIHVAGENTAIEPGTTINDYETFKGLPVGTKVTAGNVGNVYEKQANGDWKVGNGSEAQFPDQAFENAVNNGTVKTVGDAPVAEATAIDSGPSIKGAGNADLHVGDTVTKSPGGKKESTGKIVEISDDGVHVVMEQQGTGKHIPYVAKHLHLKEKGTQTSAPKTPQQAEISKDAPEFVAPPKKPSAATTDVNSPWYGKPKPEAPIAAETEQTSWVPDDFLKEIEDRYKAKIRPEWTKDSIQESSKWSLVKKAIDTGDVDTINSLHQSQLISDEMHQKTLAHIEQAKAKIEQEKKVFAELQKQHNEDLSAWKAANGVSSQTGFDDLPEMSTENFYGGPADWNKAHYGTPTVNSAFDKVNSSNAAAIHTVSVATDSSDIEDLDVQVSRVIDKNGNEVLALKFKLSPKAGDEFNKTVGNIEGVDVASELQLDQTELSSNGLVKYTGLSAWTSHKGKTYRWTDQETGAQFTFSHDTGATTKLNPTAVHNRVQVFLPTTATAEDYQKVLEKLGVKSAAPASEGDIEDYIKHRMVTLMGSKTNPLARYTPQQLNTELAAIKAEYGVDWTDMKFSTDTSGRVRVFLPDAATDKVIEKTNFNGLYHNLSSAGHLEQMLTSDKAGLIATTDRWSEGLGGHGMSSASDISEGSSDYTFHKVNPSEVVAGAKNPFDSYAPKIVAHPKAIARRMDIYGNAGDSFGKHSTGTDVYSLMGNKYTYEIMMKHGIDLSDIWFITMSESDRQALLSKLKARGITEINGLPIDNFIISHGMTIPEVDESQWSTDYMAGASAPPSSGGVA